MTPSASGTLAATPLAHALVYARNRRLSGRLDLASAADHAQAAIAIWHGAIASVTLVPPGQCPNGFFGAVAYELGLIDSATLDATLLEIAQTKRLHGEVLIARGAIGAAQRDKVLVEQIHRKVQHLFTFDDHASYAFYDAPPDATPPIAVDLVGPVWRGLRARPPVRVVEDTKRRLGDHVLRVVPSTPVYLPPEETALFQALAAEPMTLAALKARSSLPSADVDLLAYLLVIAKCVESVSGARTHPSTGALPAAMPSGPLAAASGVRRSSPSLSSIVANTSPPPARPTPGTLAALQAPSELGADAILARAAAVDGESYFEVLGVADGASEEAVRAAFLRLAKTWHPDRLVSDLAPVRLEVTQIFARMMHAQRTLCDTGARRAYVAQLSAQRAPRPRAETIAEAREAVAKRDFDTVLRLTEALTRSGTDDAEAIALHAWASANGGEAPREDLEAALKKLDRAVTVDRTCVAAIYHRGLVHKLLNNVPAAFRDFARVITLDPRHADAEREVRLFAMRVRKGSGEHKLLAPILDKLNEKK